MPQRIRFCTWNIQLGLQLDTILESIRTRSDFSSLEFLALQEASVHSGQEDARSLAEALGPTYAYHQVAAHVLGSHIQANALVWNTECFQVVHRDSVRLPQFDEVMLSRAERAVLYALPRQQRISIIADGSIGERSMRIYVAHLDVLGLVHKREQFYRILADARVRQPAADLTILAGDLNTYRIRSRPSWAGLTAAAELDGFRDLTTEIEYTHHTVRRVHFKQKLDAIFVRHARPGHYRSWSLDIPGSDHIPVFAEITLD